jgi:hypothetical protein
MSDYLIQRYEHNNFKGWQVCTKRRGKRFTRYFSDRPQGKRKALRDARAFRDKLVARLPYPTKSKAATSPTRLELLEFLVRENEHAQEDCSFVT